MKLFYDPETDSLYIDLSEKTSVDSEEVAPGIVMDFDENGMAVGLDIEHASKILDLTKLETHALPIAG
jgi:uncharacterized protein YuzE